MSKYYILIPGISCLIIGMALGFSITSGKPVFIVVDAILAIFVLFCLFKGEAASIKVHRAKAKIELLDEIMEKRRQRNA